jgi:hypothetical protein
VNKSHNFSLLPVQFISDISLKCSALFAKFPNLLQSSKVGNEIYKLVCVSKTYDWLSVELANQMLGQQTYL